MRILQLLESWILGKGFTGSSDEQGCAWRKSGPYLFKTRVAHRVGNGMYDLTAYTEESRNEDVFDQGIRYIIASVYANDVPYEELIKVWECLIWEDECPDFERLWGMIHNPEGLWAEIGYRVDDH